MIQKIQKFFDRHIRAAAVDAPLERERGLRLATAALLMEMTRADFEVSDDERQAVRATLREAFGLAEDEAAELVRLGEQEADQSTSLFPFTRIIDREFGPERKVEVVEMLWRVAFADGAMDKYEEYLVRKVADLLHVPHRDFLRAKYRAQEAAGMAGGSI